jgi:hypothetical protein
MVQTTVYLDLALRRAATLPADVLEVAETRVGTVDLPFDRRR